ncbi:L-type lectin-domain containing receptor kinase S.6-like [Papaver somniferum]|uniref:L-type lectin-domain containing receptor kinase S.6-like n=1 Tax=Papaver somniferum TaxID=3469 RepID=UPI000E6FD02C|nr:L-type lectin-domain containing receptor kinase S.6-like [Papaver somniferum]
MGFSKLFFCSLIFILCVLNLSIHSIAYASSNNITRDAYFQENGRICLTPYSPSQSPSPSSSIGEGRALHNHPIRFLDPCTNSNASFICRFSFYITSFSGSSSSSPLDISDDHIGVDINSVMSFTPVDSTLMGFDSKNGKRKTVWIEYIDSKKMVKVWVSYTKSRTIRPILATHIDLSMCLDGFMFIGFSASNGEGSAQLVVAKWRFRTYGFLPSSNSSDTRVEGGGFMRVTDYVVKNGTAELPSTELAFLVLVLVLI